MNQSSSHYISNKSNSGATPRSDVPPLRAPGFTFTLAHHPKNPEDLKKPLQALASPVFSPQSPQDHYDDVQDHYNDVQDHNDSISEGVSSGH